MPAAVAIPLIMGAASAGTSLVAAKMGSSAANKASQQQQQASTQALNFQRDVFNQQTAAMQPYMNFGQQGMDRYNQRYGGGQPQMAPQGGGVPLNFGQPSIGQRQPMGGGGQMQPGAQMADGATVQMRSPDGEVRAVPISMKARALAAGAVEV